MFHQIIFFSAWKSVDVRLMHAKKEKKQPTLSFKKTWNYPDHTPKQFYSKFDTFLISPNHVLPPALKKTAQLYLYTKVYRKSWAVFFYMDGTLISRLVYRKSWAVFFYMDGTLISRSIMQISINPHKIYSCDLLIWYSNYGYFILHI
jgi:hypothetical protein